MAESAAQPEVRSRQAISSRSAGLTVLRDPARLIFVVGTTGILAVGLVGLPLAISGIFTPVTAIPATSFVWAALAVYGWRITDHGREPGTLWSVGAVLIVLAFGAFAGLHSSQHLLTERDPGVYFVTAAWLAEHGTLLYDTGLPQQLVDSLEDPQSRSSGGIYSGPDGTSYFQFQHLPALTFAVSRWLGGDGLMFRSIAVIASVALLGIYLVARKLVGPRLALIPLVVAVVHPAFLHFAKDAYSEWFAMAFSFAAFLIWLEVRRSREKWSYLAVGALLGAGTLARIDAWWTATAFMAGMVYLTLTTGRRILSEHMRHFLGGLVAVASLGALDLILRSPEYLADLRGLTTPLLLAFAAIALSLLVLSHIAPRPGTWMGTTRRIAAPAVAVVVLVGGLFGLFLRPHLDPVLADQPNGLNLLQESEGLTLDPYRTYAESSLEWLARYQGELTITFLILATAVCGFVALRRRGDRRVPLLVVYVAVSVIYLWRPSITPDHMWALRRFVPVVLPLAFVFATWAGRLLLRRSSGGPWMASALLIVLGAAVTQSIITGAPIAAVRTQVGMVEATDELCDALPPDSVVLADEHFGTIWAGAIRTRCDSPVTRLDEPGIVTDVTEAGLVPVAVALRPFCGVDLGEINREYESPKRTLTVPPDGAEPDVLRAELTILGGDRPTSLPPIPQGAQAVLIVEVETESTPDEGYALIASLGSYLEGMWLQYAPNGIVELWVTTDQGHFGVPTSPVINDGTPRTIGGYFLDGVLYGTCGAQGLESISVPGIPRFGNQEVALSPTLDSEFDFEDFDGSVSISEAKVDSDLITDP